MGGVTVLASSRARGSALDGYACFLSSAFVYLITSGAVQSLREFRYTILEARNARAKVENMRNKHSNRTEAIAPPHAPVDSSKEQRRHHGFARSPARPTRPARPPARPPSTRPLARHPPARRPPTHFPELQSVLFFHIQINYPETG